MNDEEGSQNLSDDSSRMMYSYVLLIPDTGQCRILYSDIHTGHGLKGDRLFSLMNMEEKIWNTSQAPGKLK